MVYGQTTLTDTSDDPVNLPKHYRMYSVEVIKVTASLNFCLGNAVKYVLRHRFKGNPAQDLQKALWYLRYYNDNAAEYTYSVVEESLVKNMSCLIEDLPESSVERDVLLCVEDHLRNSDSHLVTIPDSLLNINSGR